MKETLKPQKVIMRGNTGRVSVVGIGIQNNKGIFDKIYNTLMNHHINVEMTSCSEINMTCYIDRNDVNQAQLLLHEVFFKEEK